jgi:tripartite-type tricarboxylate transporter receptor subunit TctC
MRDHRSRISWPTGHSSGRRSLEMPDVRKALADQGADVRSGSPEDLATFMRNESERWSAVVKQAGIKPE